MPDGRGKYPPDWEAFIQWLRETYGVWQAGIITQEASADAIYGRIEDNTYYKSWIAQGKPGFERLALIRGEIGPKRVEFPLPWGEAIRTKEYGPPTVKPPEGKNWEWMLISPITGEYTGGRWELVGGFDITKGAIIVEGQLMRNPTSPTGYTDYAGNIVSEEVAERILRESAEEPGITDYQRQQIALAQQELASTEAGREQELGLEEARLGLSREQLAFQREQAAGQLRLQEQERLAQLRAHPRNWIEAWFFEKGMTPPAPQYQPTVGDWGQMMRTAAESSLAQAMSALNLAAQQQPGSMLPGDGEATTAAAKRGMELLKIAAAQEKSAEQAEAIWAKERPQILAAQARMPTRPAPPTTPPAPAGQWLGLAGLTQGEPITKERTRVASGQLWGEIPWSQREMLGGYLEYASPMGVPTLQDYEELVRSHLPRTTERLGRRRPARAMV